MNKNYEVVDTQGRLWIKTKTKLKANRMVKLLKETKGIDATVKAL